jgi:GT2 family glycosyltransferase
LKSVPDISVIVPVYNGGHQFAQSLDALVASDFESREIIVVDDVSTDTSAERARARGVKVFRLASRRGPAAARNHGAAHARGRLLLFIDADVVVRRDTLSRVHMLFQTQTYIAAAFGSYDDAPAETNFISQYKNLLHHFVHQQGSPSAETFWAGCGAIRRDVFEAVGGFDETRYVEPSIEDIELGYRLRRRGFHVVLDKELQVKHLKRWTLTTLLRADVLQRAIPWSRLILESRGMINDLNLRVRQRVCAMLSGFASAFAALTYFYPALLAATLDCLVVIFLLNLDLFRFLYARRGAWFAFGSFTMQCLYYFYSGTVFTLCYFAYTLRKALARVRLIRPAATAGRVNDA